MAIKEILLLGNPLLRKKCDRVKKIADVSNQETILDLQDTLNHFRRNHGFGRGIAAPQIGVLKRIIFINIDESIALINPKIIAHSKTKMTLWDDCFSFPDILAKVKRYSKVTLTYTTSEGAKKRVHAEGGFSELLQHEIDHLDGILAIDRAIDSRHIILRSEYEKLIPTKKDIQML
ncbi:MAG: peptide deformylase [Bacteroidota bacterium]